VQHCSRILVSVIPFEGFMAQYTCAKIVQVWEVPMWLILVLVCLRVTLRLQLIIIVDNGWLHNVLVLLVSK